MAAPNPKEQKAGWAILKHTIERAEFVWVIHYSCESFYDLPKGRSPRITSIALANLDSAQTTSFSIHQVAERESIPFDQIEKHYNELEKKMLEEFFQYIGSYREMKYLHWNMRDGNYGFAALEQRYRMFDGEPFVIDNKNKIDLARLLIDIYGTGYIGHPRLPKLLGKNQMKAPGFLTGAEEAKAFEKRNYVGLHQSTLRKVGEIANLARRANDRYLKIDTSWREMHGGRIRYVLNWLSEHPLITLFGLLGSIASIIGIVLFFTSRP